MNHDPRVQHASTSLLKQEYTHRLPCCVLAARGRQVQVCVSVQYSDSVRMIFPSAFWGMIFRFYSLPLLGSLILRSKIYFLRRSIPGGVVFDHKGYCTEYGIPSFSSKAEAIHKQFDRCMHA